MACALVGNSNGHRSRGPERSLASCVPAQYRHNMPPTHIHTHTHMHARMHTHTHTYLRRSPCREVLCWLAKVVKTVLSLPHGSSDVERGFSGSKHLLEGPLIVANINRMHQIKSHL